MNIVEIWPHGEGFTDRAAFEKLYYGSFPENELRDLSDLMIDRTGAVRFLGFYEEGVFTGFMALLIASDIAHVVYFAIEEKLRGRGCGSRALAAVSDYCPGMRVIVDVEYPEQSAPNYEERLRRVAFYHKNGYRETEVRYRWRNENYVIMSHGGNVTNADWHRFWKELEGVPNLELF